ncbi:CLUMA_CG009838, isoform A [Clunio marinus]|uniref:CLUMA_CG009838, isoform A n=1 Tax=Clunio marinus TaxID=568069 RepID=A0A1J1IBQ4_9DIPT|nr:CLUMA_CG009838, isoform A [Clunio marinus]
MIADLILDIQAKEKKKQLTNGYGERCFAQSLMAIITTFTKAVAAAGNTMWSGNKIYYHIIFFLIHCSSLGQKEKLNIYWRYFVKHHQAF